MSIQVQLLIAYLNRSRIMSCITVHMYVLYITHNISKKKQIEFTLEEYGGRRSWKKQVWAVGKPFNGRSTRITWNLCEKSARFAGSLDLDITNE